MDVSTSTCPRSPRSLEACGVLAPLDPGGARAPTTSPQIGARVCYEQPGPGGGGEPKFEKAESRRLNPKREIRTGISSRRLSVIHILQALYASHSSHACRESPGKTGPTARVSDIGDTSTVRIEVRYTYRTMPLCERAGGEEERYSSVLREPSYTSFNGPKWQMGLGLASGLFRSTFLRFN